MSFDYGAYVSRTLDPQDRNFDLVLTKKGAPYATSDHNFQSDIESLKNKYQLIEVPSGIIQAQLASSLQEILGTRNSVFPLMGDQPNEMAIQGFIAKVREFVFEVRGSKANGSTTAFNSLWNFVHLNSPPAVGLRYDLVFLEVWRMLIQTSSAVGKPVLNKIWPLGNTQWGDSTSYFSDDMVDSNINKEHSARIQIQYRLRIVDGTNRINEPMTDPLVLAQGGSGAPVAGYAFTRDPKDPGLYVAGAGNVISRTQLVTPDGYVYAIPLSLIVRRNQQAFVISTNKNGSQYSIANIAVQPSDRPDGLYQNEITTNDIVDDLRHASFIQGIDYQAVLEDEFLAALAGEHQTIGKIDSFGTQDSRLLMQFDGIAPIPPGQVGIDDIASPDAFRRVFSDAARTQLSTQSLTEGTGIATGVLRYYPGATFPGPLPPPATPDIVQVVVPTVPTGCAVGIFPYLGGNGEPFAYWRTSGLPVVFTGLGAANHYLTLRRLMLSKDSISYDEYLPEIKSGMPETVNLSQYLWPTGGGDIVIGCEYPFNTIDVRLSSAASRRNSSPSVLTVEYLNGGVWLPIGLPVTDNTSLGGVSFTQDGTIDITGLPINWVQEVYRNGPKLYYIRLTQSALSTPVMLTAILPMFVSTSWAGLASGMAFAQLDTTDPAYTALDQIDVTFAVRYEIANGLYRLPAEFLKAWRNDAIQLHDLAFASEAETFRTQLIQYTSAGNQFGIEDYNVLDPTYPQDFGVVRLMRGYIQGNNTPSYVLPGAFAAAVWGPQVTAAMGVMGYYDFEQEIAPGVWAPLTCQPIGGAVRNPIGTYSITFIAAVPATRVIRYRAIMNSVGFTYSKQEKGISEIVKIEELVATQTGVGAIFELPASGRILSYETMYNPATTNNDPVSWVDPAGGVGPWGREILFNALVKNEKVLKIQFAAPPVLGAQFRISVVIAYAMPVAGEAWQICYTTPVYQGLESTLVPTDFDLVATTSYPILATVGTGQVTSLVQRDDRFANVAYRMPIASAAAAVVTDGQLQSDAVKLPDSWESRVIEYPRLESSFGSVNGTKLREQLNINVINDGTALINCERGYSDHSVKVIKPDGSQPVDYYLRMKLQQLKFATDLGVKYGNGSMIVWGALARDRGSRELFLFLFTAVLGDSNQKNAFRSTSTDPQMAFDFLRTKKRYLD